MSLSQGRGQQGITVLGCTGTIGVNTLDVIRRNPQRYRVTALAAFRSVDTMLAQCREFKPLQAAMADEDSARQLQTALTAEGLDIEVLAGVAGQEQVAAHPDASQVMAAIVGAAGLQPALAAVRAGKRVLLANKEALVMSGELFMQAVAEHGAELIPIDSEHNAIYQCLPVGRSQDLAGAGVRHLVLTASGGPFRTFNTEQLQQVTPEQAVAHPNWTMGPKISVDSATMMNKGLELIEACHLFVTTPAQVQIVVHKQSVIHSMVQYQDGSVLAQLGNPDMRTPIAHAMAWPDRIDSGVTSLDLVQIAQLDFEEADEERFGCLRLAREAAAVGGVAPAIVNAANEVAVAAFLARKINFTDIYLINYKTLHNSLEQCSLTADTLEQVVNADHQARANAQALVAALKH